MNYWYFLIAVIRYASDLNAVSTRRWRSGQWSTLGQGLRQATLAAPTHPCVCSRFVRATVKASASVPNLTQVMPLHTCFLSLLTPLPSCFGLNQRSVCRDWDSPGQAAVPPCCVSLFPGRVELKAEDERRLPCGFPHACRVWVRAVPWGGAAGGKRGGLNKAQACCRKWLCSRFCVLTHEAEIGVGPPGSLIWAVPDPHQPWKMCVGFMQNYVLWQQSVHVNLDHYLTIQNRGPGAKAGLLRQIYYRWRRAARCKFFFSFFSLQLYRSMTDKIMYI